MADNTSSASQGDVAPRFIITGDIDGQLSIAFEKLAVMQEKKLAKKELPFAFAISAGNLFAHPEESTDADAEDVVKLLDNQIEITFPTYFALGKHPLPEAIVERLQENGGEICPNLSILGRNVSVKTTEGIRIVAIGGAHAGSDIDLIGDYEPFFNDHDIQRAKQYKDTDILITADWPEGVCNGSRLSTAYADGVPPAGDPSIAELCTALKPRYHFSTSRVRFQREPFFHAGEPPLPVTSFESIPPFESPNPKKIPWAVARQLLPPPQVLPTGCTASPFKIKKRKLPDQAQAYDGYRHFSSGQNTNGGGNSYSTNGRGRGGGGKRQHFEPSRRPRPQECYFCVSADNFAAHMAISLGSDAYLTIAKGPLTLSSSFPDLGTPAHILIIPTPHMPTFHAMEEAQRTSTRKEMDRYREALQKMVSSKSRNSEGVAKLGAVTYEISKADQIHLHWQFLPIPAKMIDDKLVEVAFDVEAENLKYGSFAKTPKEVQAVEDKGDYFKAMIWTEKGEKVVALPLRPEMEMFDLQFGRRVLGKLLGLESRRHWKDCAQTVEEETKDAEAFIEIFKEFDFTRADGYGS